MKIMLVSGILWVLFGSVAVAIAPGSESALQAKSVVVYDYSSDPWAPFVVEMIARFNAAMGRPFPELVYRRMTPSLCNDVPQRKNALTVCLSETVLRGAGGGMDTERRNPHAGTKAIIVLDTAGPPTDQTRSTYVLCHEAMHALTGIPDNYTIAADGSWTWNTAGVDSCVWGDRETLGSFDISHAKHVYERFGPSRDTHRNRSHHHNHRPRT